MICKDAGNLRSCSDAVTKEITYKNKVLSYSSLVIFFFATVAYLISLPLFSNNRISLPWMTYVYKISGDYDIIFTCIHLICMTVELYVLIYNWSITIYCYHYMNIYFDVYVDTIQINVEQEINEHLIYQQLMRLTDVLSFIIGYEKTYKV